MNNRIVFSSASDHWATPQDVYSALDDEFGFDFDPCPLGSDPENGADGLLCEWGLVNFVNPPYSDIAKWCEKAVAEWEKGKTVVMLIPSRTDTRYWHNYIMRADEIRFCRGRLKFSGAKYNAPFPSAIIVFNAVSPRHAEQVVIGDMYNINRLDALIAKWWLASAQMSHGTHYMPDGEIKCAVIKTLEMCARELDKIVKSIKGVPK